MGIDVMAVALGGAFGAVSRYLITMWIYGDSSPDFPYGTMAVNFIGCLLIGILAGFFVKHPEYPMFVKLFFITGLLGGLTTFSTFSLESFDLLYEAPLYGFSNIFISLLGGLILVAAGTFMAGELF